MSGGIGAKLVRQFTQAGGALLRRRGFESRQAVLQPSPLGEFSSTGSRAGTCTGSGETSCLYRTISQYLPFFLGTVPARLRLC
jgi:hypothetical protein